jgi:hypothetical protein
MTLENAHYGAVGENLIAGFKKNDAEPWRQLETAVRPLTTELVQQ